MKKHKQTILPLLLLAVALLLVGLCDRAYAEESAQYPYLTSFEMIDVGFTGKTFDPGKDGTPIGVKWKNYPDGPQESADKASCDYVLGEIKVYTNGVPTGNWRKCRAYVTPVYTLANSDLITQYATASGKQATNIITAGDSTTATTRSDIICFTTADGTKYGYNLTVLDGSNQPIETPTEITLESIAVNRTAEDTATIYIKSNVAGTYYYAVTEADEGPSFDETAETTALRRYANTIQLTGLTAGAKKLHILAKSKGLDNVTVSFDVPKFAVAHSLSASTSLIWEDQGDKDGNRKGNVVFTNQSGTPITSAFEGETVTATAEPYSESPMYEFSFVQWKNETGIKLTEEQCKTNTVTFKMPDADVTLFAEFKNVGTTVTWGSTPNGAPAVTVNGNMRDTQYVYRRGSSANVGFNSDGNWKESWVLLGWEIMIDDVDRANDPEYVTYNDVSGYPSVKLAGDNVQITAKFRSKIFAAVTAKASPATMGSAAVSVGSSDPVESKSVVFEGQTVTLTATPKSERYKLDETNPWTVTDSSGAAIAVTPVTPETPETQADTGTTGDTGDTGDTGTTETPETPEVTKDYSQVTFTMPSTGKDITATANFVVDTSKPNDDCSLLRVELWSADGKNRLASSNKSGDTYTIELPASVAVSDLPNLRLKFICGDAANAVVKQGNTEWSKDGQACGITTLGQTQVFTVVAEDGQTSAPYKVVINAETKITAVTLLNGTETIASGKLSGSKWTITLPDSIDADLLAKIGASDTIFMKIEYAGKSLKQVATTNGTGYDDAGQKDSWASGKIMCAISPGSEAQFIVTGIDGLTRKYTIAITQPNVSTTPVLTKVSVERTSDNAATVKFTSSMAGNYFYKVVEKGAAAPTVDTTKGGTTAVKGENTITLTNLSAGARDIYIVVKSLSNVECDPFKIEIPAYGSTETPDEGDFTISVNAPPTGGTITTNRTKANEGDEIIVTVTPKTGYQMKAGSLRYAFSAPGAAYTTITGNSFKMPGGDVSITCDWETASTTVNGITAFSINGIAAAVNNTTNTITITMPRGTDVTKLTPVIATNGVKSLTPGSGVTMDFTNSVTYTATMEDGSTKTYIVTVYVNKGTLADQFWDKLTDFATQVPWWEYAKHQQSTSKYPKYW